MPNDATPRPTPLYTQAPGGPAREQVIDLAAVGGAGADAPLVSCIMATRGRAFPARHAIACFQAQSHAPRELVIACAHPDSEVERMTAGLADPRIRFVATDGAATVGDIRNAAISAARGDLVCIWDDDDLSHPQRIAWQLASLAATGAPCCVLSQLLLWWPARRRLAVSMPRIWENSMLVRRDVLPPYPSLIRGSDTALIDRLRATHSLALLGEPLAYCYVAHGGNLWGEDHFEMLFANSNRRYEGADYAALAATLAPALPLDAYERDRSGARDTI